MNNKIYRLARYYIKRCNNKWKNNQYPNKESVMPNIKINIKKKLNR